MEKRQHKDFLKFPPTLSCENARCSPVNRGSTRARRWVAGSPRGSPASARTLRRCWNNLKCDASERRFQPRKNFYLNYRQFRYAPPRVFTSSLLVRKLLNNIGLKGRQISVMLGTSKLLRAGPAAGGEFWKHFPCP